MLSIVNLPPPLPRCQRLIPAWFAGERLMGRSIADRRRFWRRYVGVRRACQRTWPVGDGGSAAPGGGCFFSGPPIRAGVCVRTWRRRRGNRGGTASQTPGSRSRDECHRATARNDVQKPALGPVVQKIADSREVNTACLRVAGVVDLGSDSRLLHKRRQSSGNIRFDRARCGWTMKSPPPGGLMNLADRPGLDRYDQRHRQRYCFNCSSNSSAEMPSSLSASARACSSSD